MRYFFVKVTHLCICIFILSSCNNRKAIQNPAINEAKANIDGINFEKYSDQYVSFNYPLNGYVETYDGYEFINLETSIAQENEKYSIFLVNVETKKRIGTANIQHWDIASEKEISLFIKDFFGEECEYRSEKKDNGVEKITAYTNRAADWPLCGHFVYEILRKEDHLIFIYGGQECFIYGSNNQQDSDKTCLETEMLSTVTFNF